MLTADHDEVLLVAVQPGEEHETGLVEASRRGKDVTRERYRRREDIVKTGRVARRQATQGGGGGRGNCVENAEQRVGVACPVAFDQVGVVVVVTGVHAHSPRKAPAHIDFLLPIEQRDLDALDFGAVCLDHGECNVHRLAVTFLAPVAGELRIEHLAEPMDDNGPPCLREDAPIDSLIIVRRACARGKRAARHEDDPPAETFDRFALFFVRCDDLIECDAAGGHELIGAFDVP